MLKIISIFMLAVLVLPSNALTQGVSFQTPARYSNYDLPPLHECKNDVLQQALETTIMSNPKWKRLVASNKLAIGLVDLKNVNNIRFAEINGNEMMYAASLPKIAILLAAMDALENKELVESKAVLQDMKLMIAKSDNRASTRMIDRLGYDKIESVLTDPKYNLYDEDNGGGLWVGKRYAAGGARNPDPLEGLSHAATTNQICRFYYMMLQGKLVCEERSAAMMECMLDPQIHHKFVNTLDKIAPDAKLFRKSGSWSTFHSDSIMVLGPKRKYILTALVNDAEGEQIMRSLVYQIEKVLKINKGI